MIDKKYAPILIRISISLLFLWFGLTQIFTDSLIGYLPLWVFNLPITPETFMLFSGLFEVVLGLLLLLGFFTRIVALLLSLHLLVISLSLGYNDVAIRDFALTLVTFSIFLNGPDEWCYKRG